MNLFDSFKEAIMNSKLSMIRDQAREFAQLITTKVMKGNYQEIKEITNRSVLMREALEFDMDIPKTREFYYGYWYAYENMGRRLADKAYSDQELEMNVASNLKLGSIITFLANNPYAQHKDLAEGLGISPSQLSTFFKKANYFDELEIFNIQKIGRNLVYSLTSRGSGYHAKKLSVDNKQYSKEMIIKILELIESKNVTHDDIKEKLGTFDEELVDFIYRKQVKFLVKRSSKRKRVYDNWFSQPATKWDNLEEIHDSLRTHVEEAS